jgi:hypothetical protein
MKLLAYSCSEGRKVKPTNKREKEG